MCKHDTLTINAVAKDHIRVICARCEDTIIDKADYCVLQGEAALAALADWRPHLVTTE